MSSEPLAPDAEADHSVCCSTPLTVKEGDFIIWQAHGDKQACVEVTSHGRIKLGKIWFSAQPLIGATYGSAFEPSKDGRTLVQRPYDATWSAAVTTEKDNSQLVDVGPANQQLTASEIQEMRSLGRQGAEIIDALTANSATWDAKTVFSQEKYMKRKSRKYCIYAIIRRPTARSICEAYFHSAPAKTWHMRVDTLALLLSYANVAAYANVLVVDGTTGLVTAAVAERMGGFGKVMACSHNHKFPPVDMVRFLNLPPSAIESIRLMSMTRLVTVQQRLAVQQQPTVQQQQRTVENGGSLETQQAQEGTGVVHAVGVDAHPVQDGTVDEPMCDVEADGVGGANGTSHKEVKKEDNNVASIGCDEGTRSALDVKVKKEDNNVTSIGRDEGTPSTSQQPPPPQAPPPRSPRRSPAGASDSEILSALQCKFDSCIIAVPSLHPSALLKQILPCLAPSTAFSIYSLWPQPLAECLYELQCTKRALCLQLQESWFREYQVLPARTHPHMSTSGTGGYILSGVVAAPDNGGPPSVALGKAKHEGGGRKGGKKRGRT